jgi:hypothetical protein
MNALNPIVPKMIPAKRLAIDTKLVSWLRRG